LDAKDKQAADLGQLPYGKCNFVVSTSPRRELLNDFQKPPKPLNSFMPVWTITEMEAIAHLCVDASGWESRFEILGGIPRHVFELTERDPIEILESACRDCSLDDCLKYIGLNSRITGKAKVVHSLVHIHSDAPYGKSSVKFATQTALEIIAREHGDIVKRQMQSLLAACDGKPLTGALCGYIFEQYAIELLEKGGAFDCRKLSDGKKSGPED
jgi:hypothetical protein